MMKQLWGELPCRVPGYVCSVEQYVQVIKHHVNKGDLALALHYLTAAERAGALGTMTVFCKIVETVEQGPDGEWRVTESVSP